VGQGAVAISGALNRLIKIAVGQGAVTIAGTLLGLPEKAIALTVYLHYRSLTVALNARSLTTKLWNRALEVITRSKR